MISRCNSTPKSFDRDQSQVGLSGDIGPVQISARTTCCKVRWEQDIDRTNLDSAMEVLEQEGRVHGSIDPDLFKATDLRALDTDQLERFVLAAARAKVSLEGCGISQQLANDLVRRIELLHSGDHSAEVASLRATLRQLLVVHSPRDIQLSAKGHSIPAGPVVNVRFKGCKTTDPIPPGQELTIATSDLETCTAVAIITKDSQANRIVTLSHIPSGHPMYYDTIQNQVQLHHSPDLSELDHEIILVSQGVKVEQLQNRWGIQNTSIRNRFEMGMLMVESPDAFTTSQEVGPTWFENSKTTLLVYPPEQRNGTGATFTLHVPADANQPVEFFLQLS